MKEELLKLLQEYREAVEEHNEGDGYSRRHNDEMSFKGFIFWLEHGYIDFD